MTSYKMKYLIFLFALLFASSAFAQRELLKTIDDIRKDNRPEYGRDICTGGFWVADTDGGMFIFDQLCSLDANTEFVLTKELQGNKRAVLVVDILIDGEKADEAYLFTVENDDGWLIDGFNEFEQMVNPFIEGLCSGHFSPLDMEDNPKIKSIVDGIISNRHNIDELLEYLKTQFSEASDFSFAEVFSGPNIGEIRTIKSSYAEEMGRGFCYFLIIEEGTQRSRDLTFYFYKNEQGVFQIKGAHYGKPSSPAFF